MDYKERIELLHEADAVMEWIKVNQKRLTKAGVNIVVTGVTKEGSLLTAGAGDIDFYLSALAQQIRATELERRMDIDNLFIMLRVMYSKICAMEDT